MNWIELCLYRGFVLVRGVFVWRCFVWKVLSRVVFVHPLLSEYIYYNIKLNITFNFTFCMYENYFLKHDVTCSWTPSPVTNCHTFSDPLPLERDVLYGRPLRRDLRFIWIFHWSRTRHARKRGTRGLHSETDQWKVEYHPHSRQDETYTTPTLWNWDLHLKSAWCSNSNLSWSHA